jgi:DNA-binding HxlR family transcriptional regulator
MKPANVYSANCPTRQILDRVGDKWAVLILLLLRQQPTRFNQLRRTIEGISQKMLSQVLKSLERDGATLAAAVDPLRDWAEHHLKEVLVAQRRYDTQSKPEAA